MGNQKPKPVKQMSLEDSIIEMKIQAKGIQRASKKAEKQSEKYKKQAKQALRKNNEEGAKLYLTSASQKRTESLNYQRTAIKMQLMCDQIKSMRNNEKMTQTFSQMTAVVSQQMNQMDTVKMSENMSAFNDKMDEVLINNKMMTELMTNNNDIGNNTMDEMMEVLKQDIAMEEGNKLIEGGQANYAHNKKEEAVDDPFLDQLKGL